MDQKVEKKHKTNTFSYLLFCFFAFQRAIYASRFVGRKVFRGRPSKGWTLKGSPGRKPRCGVCGVGRLVFCFFFVSFFLNSFVEEGFLSKILIKEDILYFLKMNLRGSIKVFFLLCCFVLFLFLRVFAMLLCCCCSWWWWCA